MEITASDARIITEIAREPADPWNVLFASIKKRASLGYNTITFDEDKAGVRFKETRKKVKAKLEELGYCVSYERVQDFLDITYHNCYKISW